MCADKMNIKAAPAPYVTVGPRVQYEPQAIGSVSGMISLTKRKTYQ
jgi:hypothetical protein